ncbi:MAG: PD-(D/E)XK nuclease family protein [Syntrophobacteraceae bacterium]
MDNLKLQEEILGLAEEGSLVLVESDRLVHQLQLRRRLNRCSREGVAWGAEGLRIVTLKHWMEELWKKSLPEIWAAPLLKRWRTISKCMEECPPPGELAPDVNLIADVDAAFDHCLRYGVDPGAGGPSNQLVTWRRELWGLFDSALEASGLFHPASLAERLYGYLLENPEWVPEKSLVVDFEFAGSWEKKLLGLLLDRPGARALAAPAGGASPQARVYADADQELYGLVEDVVESASRFPLHEIGVVVFDPEGFGTALSRRLQEVLGPPVTGEGAAYNLFPSRSLLRQPLLQAALLPLDFASGGESRTLLLSLVRSPYYGYLAGYSHTLCRWDRVWRDKSLDGGLGELIGSLSEEARAPLPGGGRELLAGLGPLLGGVPRSGKRLIGALRNFWSMMEFPVAANEGDEMSRGHLLEIMDGIEAELGDVRMTAGDLAAWIRAAAGKVFLQKTGQEDAGIQVIGALEARGLAFGRLYAPGLIAGALPQPARSLPFLSAEERRLVQGGTVESQFDYGKRLFACLLASAPEVTLSRPMMGEGGEPCLPSPFWPSEREESSPSVVPWRDALPAAQRARWVREGVAGLGLGEEFAVALSPPSEETLSRLEPPAYVSVSALEALIYCPARFLLQNLMELEPLPDVEEGLPPQDRGRGVHDVLAAFGKKAAALMEPGSGGEAAPRFEELLALLEAAASETLGPNADKFHWGVEIRRLMGGEGEGEIPGLLRKWLREEWGRMQEGWKWVACERSFSGLKPDGSEISVTGRLDRLDRHPEEGWVCWDYKTGKPPEPKGIFEDFSKPQLPAYLLAIRKGLAPDVDADGELLGAGYIVLRSVRDFRRAQHIDLAAGDLDRLLKEWESVLGAALRDLGARRISPRWAKGDACDPCPYASLCGKRFAAVGGSASEESDS